MNLKTEILPRFLCPILMVCHSGGLFSQYAPGEMSKRGKFKFYPHQLIHGDLFAGREFPISPLAPCPCPRSHNHRAVADHGKHSCRVSNKF